MTESEVPTIQSIHANIERLQGDLATAKSAHSDAVDAVANARTNKSVDIEALLGLADAVGQTTADVSNAESRIDTANKQRARLQWEADTELLRVACSELGDGIRGMVTDRAGVFAEHKATGLGVTISNIGEPDMLIEFKPTGPDIPKPPGAVKRTGGGTGKRATHSVTADGQTMTPREYVAAHIEETTDKIRASLGGDTTNKVNITHEAERIAKKLNDTFV